MKKIIKKSYAVSGFIYHQGKFLLLKDPKSKYWMPPGGKIEKGEFLIDALKREIREETKLRKIKVLRPFIYWRGLHNNEQREGLSFLCLYQSGKVKISFEHSNYQWSSPQQIKKLKITHDPANFILAKKIIKILNKNEK